MCELDFARFQASAAVRFRPSLFRNVMRRRLVLGYEHFGETYLSLSDVSVKHNFIMFIIVLGQHVSILAK